MLGNKCYITGKELLGLNYADLQISYTPLEYRFSKGVYFFKNHHQQQVLQLIQHLHFFLQRYLKHIHLQKGE